MFLSYSLYDWKAKTPDTRQRSGVLFYAMQQKSPRNSEALYYGCIYPFWKLTRIMHRFFCMVNCFSKNHQKHAEGDNKKRVSHSVNDFPYRQKRHKIFSFCPFRQECRIGVGHHFAPLVLLMMDLRCCARYANALTHAAPISSITSSVRPIFPGSAIACASPS